MTKNIFPRELVEEEVRRIAAKNPDFVYKDLDSPGCHYTAPAGGTISLDKPNPTQGCIMGRALYALGASPQWLRQQEGASIGSIVHPPADREHFEALWLDEVQAQQDRGSSWGHAVEMADWIMTEETE